MDRLLALDMIRVTEAAALAAARLMGRGDEKAADAAAVHAMREEFNRADIHGTVVIGEGERDEAPMPSRFPETFSKFIENKARVVSAEGAWPAPSR